MRRNFTTLLALGEGAERLLLHGMTRFHRVGDLFRGGRKRRGGVNHKTARGRLFAGEAGGDGGEIVMQCLLNRFSSQNSCASYRDAKREMYRSSTALNNPSLFVNSAYSVGALAPVASTRSESEVASYPCCQKRVMALSSAASLSNTFGRPRLFFAQLVTSVVICRWSSVGLLNNHYKINAFHHQCCFLKNKLIIWV